MVIVLLHYRSGCGQLTLGEPLSPYKESYLSFWSADDAAERRMRSGVCYYCVSLFKNFGGRDT